MDIGCIVALWGVHLKIVSTKALSSGIISLWVVAFSDVSSRVVYLDSGSECR